MKKNIILFFISLIVFFKNNIVFAQKSQVFVQNLFSESQLRSDLLFYKRTLENLHPNLYLYTSIQELDLFFDSLTNSINQPINEAEFYQKITLTSNKIKDGHTLILPSNHFTDFHNTNSKFLPFQIGFIDEKLFVRMNFTRINQLEDGTVIDSINGVSSKLIIQNLLNGQVRDGNNISYAKWILDTYFREYYSYTFGHPENYRVSYTKNNFVYTFNTPALLKDSIYYYRQKNYPNLFSVNSNDKGIFLKYDTLKRIGIITIKDFHTDILKEEYKQDFNTEIKAILNDVIQNKIQNLIFDLRNNQGGDVENGVYLLKYLIAKPFKVVNEYQKLKNGRIVECKGPSMGIHKPFKKKFKGQIYILLNGGSFSNSVIFSSCLRENTNAIFVGSQSGGNPNVLAGDAEEFKLPNTKINIQVPTKRFVMTNMKSNNGFGLVPTHNIENSLENLTHQKDSQLDFLLNLIE